MIFKTHST